MVSGWPDGRRRINDERIINIARHAAEKLRVGVTSEGRAERMTANADLMF
jgi:hypothetical protein